MRYDTIRQNKFIMFDFVREVYPWLLMQNKEQLVKY